MEFDTLIFSETILAFLSKARSLAKSILFNEMKIKIGRKRFYYKEAAYPLHIVAFEDFRKLGYFHSHFYEIGLNKTLILKGEDFLSNILRHELAHYITFIENGPLMHAHGKEFQAICKRYRWGKEVSLAFQSSHITQKDKKEKVFEKIQKLLALSNSPNKEEAKAALIKAKSLATEHNLNTLKYKPRSDQDMYVMRLLQVKKVSAKLETIATILRHFFVYPVFNRGKGVVYLEIFGEKANVTIGNYVAYFLDKELENLWQAEGNLKGARSKNSFFRGIAAGYKEKTQKTDQEEKALIVLKQKLTEKLPMAYPHLCSISSHYKTDKKAEALGKNKGETLQVRPGIFRKIERLITWK